MRRRIRLISDVDKTLVRPNGTLFAYYCEAVAAYLKEKYFAGKHPEGISAWDRLRRNLRAAGCPHDDATVKEAVRRISALAVQRQRDWLPLVEPMPGAVEFLRRCYAHPLIDGSTYSANMRGPGETKLAGLGLSGFIDPYSSAWGDEAWSRPEIGGLVLDRSGTHPDDAVIVGDTPQDAEAGRVLGVRVVAVATGDFTREELLAAGADVVLDDLTDVDAAIAAILGQDTRSLVAA